MPHRFTTLDGYRAIAALVVHHPRRLFHRRRGRHRAGTRILTVRHRRHHLLPVVRVPALPPVVDGGAEGLTTWPATRRYFRRRLWRILPAYLLLVVVVLAVMPGIEVHPKHWISHLTLTQIYWPQLLISGLTQTWSLATELSFYLVLPLLVWVDG